MKQLNLILFALALFLGVNQINAAEEMKGGSTEPSFLLRELAQGAEPNSILRTLGAEKQKAKLNSMAAQRWDSLGIKADSLVKVVVGAQSLSVPKSILTKFSLLETLLEIDEQGKEREIELFTEQVNFEALKDLLAIMQGADSTAYSAKQLVQAVVLADFLGIKDWSLLKSVGEQIKAQATPELALWVNQNMPAISLSLDINKAFKIRELDNVKDIYWSRINDQYLIKFGVGRAQLYGPEGQEIGAKIRNVKDIYWSPLGDKYWVVAIDGIAQMYNAAGQAIGTQIDHVRNIYWSPVGDRYWIMFRGDDYRTQMYSADGQALDIRLSGVLEIDWSPLGDRYWVIFRDHSAQMYNVVGQAIGTQRDFYYRIDWSPAGDKYLAGYVDQMLGNGTAQMYNVAGQQLGSVFSKVNYIYWNPKGDRYWVQFNDHKATLYSVDGQAIGISVDHVKNIYLDPLGDKYWVIFRDGLAQLYNSDGQAIGTPLDNVRDIYWGAKGNRYWVRFADDRAKLYEAINFNYASLSQQMLVQYMLNQFEKTQAPVELAAKYRDLLDENIKKILMGAGYLVSPTTAPTTAASVLAWFKNKLGKS